jgi:hypothetical protein
VRVTITISAGQFVATGGRKCFGSASDVTGVRAVQKFDARQRYARASRGIAHVRRIPDDGNVCELLALEAFGSLENTRFRSLRE